MFDFSLQRRKKRKEKQKNKLENLQCAEPAFTASIGYPRREGYEPFLLVLRVSIAFFACLR
jgi:hypothetical protein